MKCISPVYVRKVGQHVPCGKCAFCIKKLIDSWCLRLYHELEVSSNAHFITLTYEDKNLPPGENVSKRDIQLFIKRLRKVNPGIKYFAVGEYGSQFKRPHYHAVIFNLVDLDVVHRAWCDRDGNPFGFVSGSRATMGRIRYMVSYMAGPQPESGKEKAFRLMSKGIGKSYVEKMKHFHRARSDSVVYVFDTPNAMPRYYKDKIYSNPHLRALVVRKCQEYSEENPRVVCPVEHDRLLEKLQRKFK